MPAVIINKPIIKRQTNRLVTRCLACLDSIIVIIAPLPGHAANFKIVEHDLFSFANYPIVDYETNGNYKWIYTKTQLNVQKIFPVGDLSYAA